MCEILDIECVYCSQIGAWHTDGKLPKGILKDSYGMAGDIRAETNALCECNSSCCMLALWFPMHGAGHGGAEDLCAEMIIRNECIPLCHTLAVWGVLYGSNGMVRENCAEMKALCGCFHLCSLCPAYRLVVSRCAAWQIRNGKPGFSCCKEYLLLVLSFLPHYFWVHFIRCLFSFLHSVRSLFLTHNCSGTNFIPTLCQKPFPFSHFSRCPHLFHTLSSSVSHFRKSLFQSSDFSGGIFFSKLFQVPSSVAHILRCLFLSPRFAKSLCFHIFPDALFFPALSQDSFSDSFFCSTLSQMLLFPLLLPGVLNLPAS